MAGGLDPFTKATLHILVTATLFFGKCLCNPSSRCSPTYFHILKVARKETRFTYNQELINAVDDNDRKQIKKLNEAISGISPICLNLDWQVDISFRCR